MLQGLSWILKQTNQLKGLTFKRKIRDYDKDETDEKGNFKIESISGGFRCPPMTVIVTKEGYETLTVKISNGNDKTIRLKRKSK